MLLLVRSMVFRLALLLIVCSLLLEGWAQPFPNLYFHSITENEGLSSNLTNSITQDVNGFVWVGTTNGLNRYDGQRFAHFFSNGNDSTALQHSNVSVTVNANKQLYVRNDDYAAKYYPTNNTFINVTTPTWLNSFLFDGDTTYLVSATSGLYQLQEDNTLQKKNIQADTLVFDKAILNFYRSIVKDALNRYWAYSGNYLYQLDKTLQQKLLFLHLPTNVNIHSIFLDDTNKLWVTTSHGLYFLDEQKNSLQLFNNQINDYFFANMVRWLYNNQAYLVVGTNRGLLLIDEVTLQYKLYSNELRSAENGNENLNINAVFIDKNNNLWLATNEGVRMAPATQMLFRKIPIGVPNKKDISYTEAQEVYQFKETEQGYWVTKRYGGGIFHYTKNWQLLKHWKGLMPISSDRYRKNGSTIDGFDFKQKGNTLYISTESGLVLMDLTSYATRIIYPDNIDTIPRLRTIVAINDTTWLIRSFYRGVFAFNPVKNSFGKHYRISWASYILQTTGNEIFLSSEKEGLFRYRPTANQFEEIKQPSFKKVFMQGMAEDKSGVLWIATINGLITWNPDSDTISAFYRKFPEMGFVSRVVADKYNNIWFNCQQGYWCWRQDKQEMLRFGYKMKLPDNRAESGFFSLGTNKIYGGGRDALVEFDTDLLYNYKVAAEAIITRVDANGVTIFDSPEKGKTTTLSLEPNQRDIGILFSVMDYSAPDSYELFYRIQEKNENWQKVPKGQILIHNLERGNYTIEVRGKSHLTGEYSQSDVLAINIQPHWYQTTLFKLLALLFMAFLIIWAYKYRIMQVKKTARLKAEYENRMLSIEMQNLRSQMNPHFIFNSLNSINSFIVENKTHLASDYLTKFSRLIRLILDHSKNESITLEKELETLRLYFLMEGIRFEQKFDYAIHVAPEIDEQLVKVPPMIIQPYVENAIWHGLLHKVEKGTVTVRIKRADEKNGNQIAVERLLVEIEDDGIGRNKATELKSKTCTSNKSYGMQITAQRILQLHKENNIETIDLKDEKGNAAGTKVSILLLLH